MKCSKNQLSKYAIKCSVRPNKQEIDQVVEIGRSCFALKPYRFKKTYKVFMVSK